jgi:hypothetical protein
MTRGEDLLTLLQRSLDLARRGELRAAMGAVAARDSEAVGIRVLPGTRAPRLPDSLYWDPSIPDPPRPAPVFPGRGPVALTQMEAQLARIGVYDAYRDEGIWRFCEIRRRARSRRRRERRRLA